jgi:hypothetical protein
MEIRLLFDTKYESLIGFVARAFLIRSKWDFLLNIVHTSVAPLSGAIRPLSGGSPLLDSLTLRSGLRFMSLLHQVLRHSKRFLRPDVGL